MASKDQTQLNNHVQIILLLQTTQARTETEALLVTSTYTNVLFTELHAGPTNVL